MVANEKFISRRITELRLQKNVSARDMSLSLGQSESYINKIENGKAMPSMAGFFYICDYFRISPVDFFNADIECPPLLNELYTELQTLSADQICAVMQIIRAFRQD